MVRNAITVRSNVSSNDSANPAIAGGANCFGYEEVVVEVALTGTTPQWNVTPLFLNASGDAYSEGETVVVSGVKTHRFYLRVDNNTDVNFRLDGQSGSSPVVSSLKVIFPIAKKLN